jgi:hypothetical protein
MWPNQFSRLTSLSLLLVTAAIGQPAARLDLKSPRPALLVARTLQLVTTPYAESGARVDATLEYSVQPAALASVSKEGLLRGVAPGTVTVTVRDSGAGASSQIALEVRPLRIELEPSQMEVRLGETARVSALALDADGRVIPNQVFRFATGLAAVATVSADGVVRPVAEGTTSLVASIAGTAIAGGGTVRVLRKSDYRLTRLQDTRPSAPSLMTAVQEVTAAGTRIAYLATLANGGQAAVIDENGRRRVLLAAGQYLPTIGRLAIRLTNISINTRGDAAILVETSDDPWCATAIIVIRAAGNVEEASAGCSLFLHPHGLAENGNVIFQVGNGDQGSIREYASNGVTRSLLSMAALPPEMTDVTGINWNSLSPSRYGDALSIVSTVRGGTEAWHYNGQRWQRAVRIGDTVDGSTIQWINNRAFAGADGRFFTRFGDNGILQMAPGQTRVLTKNQYPYANGIRQSGSHSVVDVLGDRVLICANLVKDDKDLTYLAVIRGDNATPLAESNWMWEGGGFLADGRVAAVVLNQNELRPSVLDGTNATPLYPAGTTVDAPAFADWRYPVRGAASKALVMRGAGESLVETGSGVNRVLVSSGARLPGSEKPLIAVSAVAASANGTVAFMGSFPAGHGLYLWRGGQLSLLIDSVGAVRAPGGAALSSLPAWRHRMLAVNNRGETVFQGSTRSNDRLLVIAPGDTQAREIGTIGSPLLGGVLNGVDHVAIDEDGRVSFIGRLNGKPTLFFWDRAKVDLIAQSGPALGNQPPLTDFFSIAASGREHVVVINYNWTIFAIRSYDGARWKEVTATSDSRAGNLAFRSSYGPSQLTGSCYLAQPIEGTSGAYCAKPDGKIAIVGRLGDRMPGGGTMLAPLGITVADSGEVYLAAQVYENGREFVALYLASPL